MPRRLALLVLLSCLLAVPTAGAQTGTPVPPTPPTQPTTGPGSSEALFGGFTTIEQKSPGEAVPDYWVFVPADPLPGAMQAREPFPVVIFVHGSGAVTPVVYQPWIEHLVRRGAVVLYPQYEVLTPGEPSYLGYRKTLQDDVRAGLETLEREGVPVDPTRVAVVGHSLGADQALVYAASAAAAGLPVPTAVMSVALGSCPATEGACLGTDLGAIPATTRVLLVAEADDYPSTALVQIWAELEGVPLENRDVVTLVSDAHGKPGLHAVHIQALTGGAYGPPNALDWYGTWKWLDALMGCAVNGEWCAYALGNTPEQRFMGTWSDGVPVAEAMVTDDPAAA